MKPARQVLTSIALLMLAFPGPTFAQELSTYVAVEWNEHLLSVAEAEDGFLTLKGVRAAAMMHLAMHNALNSIVGRYEVYQGNEVDGGNEVYEIDEYNAGEAVKDESSKRDAAYEVDADYVAAAVAAAFVVAADQYPEQTPGLRALRDKHLAMLRIGGAFDRGLVVGRAAANTILQLRADDGWDNEAEYKWHPMGPGVYAEFNEHSGTPEGFVFGAGWGGARPFGMKAPEQFMSPPPPGIDSDAYTRAFNEVKEVGRFQTVERTVDQTHLALWWKDFAENSHNRLARTLVMKDGINLVDATRLFALINMNIFDAYVSSFHNKFVFNHWRPYTAIRWAANDGNPDTVPDETWTNLHMHTYAFPSYPSAHGTACAAAMTALSDVFGDKYGFTMVNAMVDIAGPFSGKMDVHPPTRTFANFSAAARECGLSRLYLGIHFRYDSVEGVKLGESIGKHALESHLRRRD